jgi:hypothetical protein
VTVLQLVDRLSRRIMRRGLRQGMLEGSSLWLVVGMLAWLFRLLTTAEQPKVVREEIALGESIVVTHLPAPPTRRARRRAERAVQGASGPHGAA